MRPARHFIPPRLRSRLTQARDLDALLQASLDEAARPHCRAGGISRGRLVVVTDSAVWATRLRFEADALLARMRETARGTHPLPDRIHVRVGPVGPVRRRPLPAVRVPDSARGALLSAAATVDDTRLARSLRRLARRAVR